MFYDQIQKISTDLSKTRDESIELIYSAYNDLQSLLFPADPVNIAAVWESKTYKKIKEIAFSFWREAISGMKAFYCEDTTLTIRTGQTSLITIAKSNMYNFDFAVWKKSELFGIDSGPFLVSIGDLVAITESGDNYVFECYAKELDEQENNFEFSGLFTPYKTVTGIDQLLYDMAKYNSTATDADRQALSVKSEKLKEYSYTKEKGDSEAFNLAYPDPIIKKLSALRKRQVPFIV